MIKKITSAALAITSIAVSADAPESLKKQLVTIENGTMKYAAYESCLNKITNLKEQVSVVATAPADDFISRDNFIFMAAELYTEYRQRNEKLFSDCETKDSLIGTPNFEFRIDAYEAGIQLKLLDNGSIVTSTAHTWEELN